MAFFVVDRFEGGVAVLVGDDNRTFEVPVGRLPKGVAEDKVLRVKVGSSGEPDWSQAVIDDVEQKRRIEEARKAYDRFKQQDPGGDISI